MLLLKLAGIKAIIDNFLFCLIICAVYVLNVCKYNVILYLKNVYEVNKIIYNYHYHVY